MNTLVPETVERVKATGVRFVDDALVLELSDLRQIWLPMRQIHWLNWLAQASPQQRANWEILPMALECTGQTSMTDSRLNMR